MNGRRSVGDRTVCMCVTDHGRGVEGMEDIMESANATVKQFLPLNTKNAPYHWLLSFNFPKSSQAFSYFILCISTQILECLFFSHHAALSTASRSFVHIDRE
jgi:hypothetical protein